MYDGLSGQKKGILFLTAVVIVFMQGGLWSARRQSVDNFPDNSLLPVKTYLPFTKSNARPTVKEHPIPKLMAEAEANYRQLLSRQSQTLEDAVREYERRYKRKPPRGFDDWWRFARNNSVVMIDEYDNINEDLAPFWEISAEQVRWRASLVCAFVMWRYLAHSLYAGRLPAIRRRCPRERRESGCVECGGWGGKRRCQCACARVSLNVGELPGQGKSFAT